MTEDITVIETNERLFLEYQALKKGDIICTRLRCKPGQENIYVDLLDRGIRLIPSGSSQLASRSKCLQARMFADFMLATTTVVFDKNDLLAATSTLQRSGKVILKMDRKNGGLGIFSFDNIEILYNQIQGGGFPFPFVIQPFINSIRDIRVIIIDEYIEAYERVNKQNFRKNLHCGGDARSYSLSQEQLLFCRSVMERGQFPYAHLDLMIAPDKRFYLTEINLKGGLKGAKISSEEYKNRIETIHRKKLAELLTQQ